MPNSLHVQQRRIDLRQQIQLVRFHRRDASHEGRLKALVADEGRRFVAVFDVLGVREQERQQVRQRPLLDVLDQPFVETASPTFGRLLVEKIQHTEDPTNVRHALQTERRLSNAEMRTAATDKAQLGILRCLNILLRRVSHLRDDPMISRDKKFSSRTRTKVSALYS